MCLMHDMQAVMSALKAVHSEGLLHGDIRSENVLLSGDSEGFLLDYGFAKQSRDREKQKAERAQLRGILGPLLNVQN